MFRLSLRFAFGCHEGRHQDRQGRQAQLAGGLGSWLPILAAEGNLIWRYQGDSRWPAKVNVEWCKSLCCNGLLRSFHLGQLAWPVLTWLIFKAQADLGLARVHRKARASLGRAATPD